MIELGRVEGKTSLTKGGKGGRQSTSLIQTFPNVTIDTAMNGCHGWRMIHIEDIKWFKTIQFISN